MKQEITIEYKGVELDIEYWYQPYEPEERFYPGCPASIEEISEIKHKSVDLMELLEDQLEDIEKAIWEQITKE